MVNNSTNINKANNHPSPQLEKTTTYVLVPFDKLHDKNLVNWFHEIRHWKDNCNSWSTYCL